MCPKKRAAAMSAADKQDVGWPLPAAVVEVIEWIRSWLAIADKVSAVVFIISNSRLICAPTSEKKSQYDNTLT